MRNLFKYFFDKQSFESNIESFRAKTLLLFILSGLSILIVFIIKTAVSGNPDSLYIQFVHFTLIIISLFLLKIGKHILVGNILSIVLIIVEILSTFLNFSGAESYNFFIDEFYLLLAFLLFSAMFANRSILMVNTILIIASAVSSFVIFKENFPPELVQEFSYGLNVYVLVVIIIFIFSYLYTYTILNAMKEIANSAEDTEEKNIQLEKNAELLNKQKDELFIAKMKAEESDRLKTSFLANMSHEIRTPMNAILGFSNLLKSSELNKTQEEYLKIIENSGTHLLELINDIIDISELESNQIRIHKSKVNINKIISDVTDIFKAEILKKNKDIKIITQSGFPRGNDIIFTDEKRLKQILINLIGNSIKFTETGTIKISYKAVNGEIIFKIIDTGIGISEDELPIIFNRFRQADETNTREYGGTGLGLAISKACVSLLGGSINAESIKDAGSTFTFTIPNFETKKIIDTKLIDRE